MNFRALSTNPISSLRQTDREPLVLLLGMADRMGLRVPTKCRIIESTQDEAIEVFTEEHVDVLVLGPSIPPSRSRELLDQLFEAFSDRLPTTILTNAGFQPDLFHDFVARDLLFFLTRSAISDQQLSSLTEAAIHHHKLKRADRIGRIAELQAASDLCGALQLQNESRVAAQLLVETARDVLRADRTAFFWFDENSEAIHALDAPSADEQTAAAGLVGYVARTLEGIRVERLGSDPRYDPEVDDFAGNPNSSFLVQPVFGTGNALIGLLTASRDRESGAFDSRSSEVIEILTTGAASYLSVLLLVERLQEHILRPASSTGRPCDIFRQEALTSNAGTDDPDGSVLLSPPPRLRRAPWIVLGLTLMALASMATIRVNDFEVGEAAIVARDSSPVLAPVPGHVRSIDVTVGQHVERGQLLAGIDLRGANDQPLQVRSPRTGLVKGMRSRAGDTVFQGAPLMDLVDPQAGFDVFAVFPQSDASKFRVGMTLTLRSNGGRNPTVVQIDRIGAGTLLGPLAAHLLSLEPSDRGFSWQGIVLHGTSNVIPITNSGLISVGCIVGSEPLLVRMFPKLEKWKL